jgi:hypothetical protein
MANMNDAKNATNAGINALGFISGFCFLSVIMLVINDADLLPVFVLSLSTTFFFIALTLLLMAGRKFGSNEVEIASKIIKKANIVGFLGIIGALLTLVLLLAGFSLLLTAVFLCVMLSLIFALWLFGKKNFKYW